MGAADCDGAHSQPRAACVPARGPLSADVRR